MQELIQKIQEKAGISAEQANTAFQTIKDFIQEKLPSNLGINIDDVLNGNFDLSSIVSGLFGNGNSNDSSTSNENPLDKLKNMF